MADAINPSGNGNGAAPQQPQQQQPVPEQAQLPLGPQGGPGMLPPSNISVATGAQAPAPQTEWEGILEVAKQKGLELPYSDDQSALDGLLAAYRDSQQLGPYAQIGQQVAPYYDKFQAYLAQQQQQAQQPAQQQKVWDAPEFDQSWLSQVTTDSAGNIIPATGQSPEIAMKVRNYLNWQNTTLKDMARDPVSKLGPVIKHLAREEANQLIQEQLGQMKTQMVWEQFSATNHDWMVQKDAGGNPMIDPSGKPRLSQDGQAFASLLGEAKELGIGDSTKQIQYAMKLLGAQRATAQRQAPAPMPMQQPQQPQPQFNLLRSLASRSQDYSSAEGNQSLGNDPAADLRNLLTNRFQTDSMFRQAISAQE